MRHLMTIALLAVLTATVNAQPARQQPAAKPAEQQAAARPAESEPEPGVPANIRFDVTIRDEGGGGPATRRTVSLVVRGNNFPGSVRSVGHLPASHPLASSQASAQRVPLAIPLNVDVRGSVTTGKRIQARVTVEYQPFWADAKTLPSSVRAQVDAILDDGRAMLLSQAVDPITDRRTIIEVTATVLN
jgi:hypothetical protein